jgi:hypothetical protein
MLYKPGEGPNSSLSDGLCRSGLAISSVHSKAPPLVSSNPQGDLDSGYAPRGMFHSWPPPLGFSHPPEVVPTPGGPGMPGSSELLR